MEEKIVYNVPAAPASNFAGQGTTAMAITALAIGAYKMLTGGGDVPFLGQPTGLVERRHEGERVARLEARVEVDEKLAEKDRIIAEKDNIILYQRAEHQIQDIGKAVRQIQGWINVTPAFATTPSPLVPAATASAAPASEAA